MTCRTAVDIDKAIYRNVWTLSPEQFKSCRRFFLRDLTVAELYASIRDIDYVDHLQIDKELWELHYTDEAYPAIFNLPDTAKLLISCRHKVLQNSLELKIALVTIHNESKRNG